MSKERLCMHACACARVWKYECNNNSDLRVYQCFHALTSQPEPLEDFFPAPSSSPSRRNPWLPGNRGRCRCPWARTAADESRIQAPNRVKQNRNRRDPLTSKRLSPTSATSSLWPLRCRTMAAFSDAYMQVKSNMATSGWP